MALTSFSSLLPEHWDRVSIAEIASLAPVQVLDWPLLNQRGIQIAIKRDELLGPELSGNKLYKLHGHIQAFRLSGRSTLASFGGAYSNHIYALAAAGKALNIPTVGVIRGERPKQMSPTLCDVSDMGMKLVFVSRTEYKRKDQPAWLHSLGESLGGDVYWVPEGGGDERGAMGCYHWAKQSLAMSPWQPTHLCLAAGTGATASGVLSAAVAANAQVHAFLALKGGDDELRAFKMNILSMAQSILSPPSEDDIHPSRLVLERAYHCGGYAKFPESLRQFLLGVESEIKIVLDPVYTAKLFWGIAQKAEQGLWPHGSRLLVFHTGGIQGRRGYAL